MLNQKTLLTLIASLFSFSTLFGQSPAHFTTDSVAEQELVSAITARYQKDVQNLQGANKKYLAEIYKERLDYIKKKISEKEISCDNRAQAYLNDLTKKIFASNSFLRGDELRILFSRTYLPNAYSMGEGTILFNMGLFHRLQNEGQAAFVLCHELAHYYLNHSNNSIAKYVNTVYSDDFQKELKRIQKSEYGRRSEVEKLAKNLTFKNRRHAREFEQSADSMALELMKNTGYDVQEVLTCLALLDSVDYDKYHKGLTLEKQFHFASYPFKKSWLEEDDLKFVVTKTEEGKQEEDSLKTHPDCKLRIERLKQQVSDYYKPSQKSFLIDEKEFNRLKVAADYEIINYAFQSKKISKALFLALEMYGAFPDDVFLQAAVGKGLNQIYTHQKEHTLGTVVDLPAPEFESSYNNFLRFIQNLRLTEVAAISYYFMMQHQTQSYSNETFLQALIESKDHFDKATEKQQWVDYYKKTFLKTNTSF
jgi:predicted Zn-dependent protease